MRPRHSQKFGCSYVVSIHAPTRGATLKGSLRPRSKTFQSTHPHGVRQKYIDLLVQLLKVSIHAPTRGATYNGKWEGIGNEVSIHAPTRGATCDIRVCQPVLNVSIHAPTRGATTLGKHRHSNIISFNPRTHTGCDMSFLYVAISIVVFQSTHPHGVRLKFAMGYAERVKVSIHAPTRGATCLG